MPVSPLHLAPGCGGAGFGPGSSCGSDSSGTCATQARWCLRAFLPSAEPQLQPALIVLALALAGSLGLFFWLQWVRWLGLLPMLTIAGFACTAWQANRLGDHLLDQTVAGETVTARIE